jgi:hypothetical protein
MGLGQQQGSRLAPVAALARQRKLKVCAFSTFSDQNIYHLFISKFLTKGSYNTAQAHRFREFDDSYQIVGAI